MTDPVPTNPASFPSPPTGAGTGSNDGTNIIPSSLGTAATDQRVILSSQAAWRSPKAWLWLCAVSSLGLFTDLISKSLAFKHIAATPVVIDHEVVLASQHLSFLIPPHDPIVVVPGLLELTLVLNPGAVFGMGAGKRTFFIVFTAVAMLFALWMFAALSTRGQRLAHAAIGLLLAGGLGNLYDRVQFACVRDFLHPLPGVRWPAWAPFRLAGAEVWPYVSNLADLWLLIGIGIFMIHSLRSPPQQLAAKSSAKV